MVTQILNFGLPAQIDVRTVGPDVKTNLRIARELRRRMADIPGLVDAHIQQEVDGPGLLYDDRPLARAAGRAQRGVDRQQRQHQPELVQAGQSQLLDRSQVGDPLLLRGADAAVLGELARRAAEYAGLDQHRAEQRLRDGRAGPGNDQQHRHAQARQRADQLQPDERAAGLRGLCGRAGPRSGQRVRRHRQDRRRAQEGVEARQHHPGSRPDPEHGRRLRRPRHRPPVRVRARLPADGRQLPELRRAVRGHPGAAGDIRRHLDHAFHHRDDAERSLAHGCDHGGGRRVGELDPAGDVRARAAARRPDLV